MPVAVEASQLSVVFGRRRILDGLMFSVPVGQVTGLLGPSGSGKTTLMRCVVGVQRVDSGELTVLGQPAGSAELRHRVVALTLAAATLGLRTGTMTHRARRTLAPSQPGRVTGLKGRNG